MTLISATSKSFKFIRRYQRVHQSRVLISVNKLIVETLATVLFTGKKILFQKMSKDVEFVPLEDALSKEMQKSCLKTGMPTAEVLVQPYGVAMPRRYMDFHEKIRDMEVRKDDVWIITFPKCGNVRKLFQTQAKTAN